jgi:hypothetical protein
MPHRIYKGTKVYLIRSPCPCLCRAFPNGHASPLGYFDRVIFKLQDFSWQRRTRYLGCRANRQVKINKQEIGQGLFGVVVVAATRKPNVFYDLSHRWQWQDSKGERDALSHVVSPHLGTPLLR